MQDILYRFKRDVAAWKRLGCPQHMQQSWWQIVATPSMGFRLLLSINFRAHMKAIYLLLCSVPPNLGLTGHQRLGPTLGDLKLTWINLYYLNHPEIISSQTGGMKQRQNGCHFADDTFKLIFLYQNCCILILKFVSNGPINNNPAMVQIMASWHASNKWLSEPIMAKFIDAHMHHSASMS